MLKLADCQAFTIKFRGKANVLGTEVGISESFDLKSEENPPEIININAVWDTGASTTCISQKVVTDLGLSEIDKKLVHTANNDRLAGVYLVNIYLPNGVAFDGIRVVDMEVPSTDILIGMDIINKGDFAVTHKKGFTCMTFQIPSYHNIDFVEEIKKERQKIKDRNARKNARQRKNSRLNR